MPKETFIDGPRELVISWGRDTETVQLGVRPRDQHGDTAEAGQFVTVPTRAQVNRLIRSLKTARDQAFGRDE